MSQADARDFVSRPPRRLGETLRVAFVGHAVWVAGCAPAEPANGFVPAQFVLERDFARQDGAREMLVEFAPHVTVVFDPTSFPADWLGDLPGATLALLVTGAPDGAHEETLEQLDRVASFDPSLTGARVGGTQVWRAIPPPVSDQLFTERPRPHRYPRAISIGRSTEHREAMLLPAKHHHDLLQVIHGVTGPELRELLAECDVGVFIAASDGGGFGLQVGMHLASAQLLLAEELTPDHGLEPGIDYLRVRAPDELVWILERLARFPEMHERIRIRGRLKAEQYRASRLFARLAHDLLRDVAAFGSPRSA